LPFLCVCVLLAVITACIATFIAAIINSLPVEGCESVPDVVANTTQGIFVLERDLSRRLSVYVRNTSNAVAYLKHRSFSFPYSIDFISIFDKSISVGKGSFLSLGQKLEVREACSNAFCFIIQKTVRQGIDVYNFQNEDGIVLATAERPGDR
jgi:hypothetical protein